MKNIYECNDKRIELMEKELPKNWVKCSLGEIISSGGIFCANKKQLPAMGKL